MHKIILFYLIFILSSCHSHQLATDSETTNYRINRQEDSVEPHPIQDLITPYKDDIDAQMKVVIGSLETSMIKVQPECNLGNWITDAMQQYAKQTSKQLIDASILNHGGIRVLELMPGPIQLGEIYEIMPFDNTLVIVEMNSEILQRFFNVMALDKGWPVSAEVSYEISDGKAVNITLSGQAIDPNRLYHIAMPNFIANGNGGCFFLAGLDRIDTGVFVRDVLINNVKEQHRKGLAIRAKTTGRVRKKE